MVRGYHAAVVVAVCRNSSRRGANYSGRFWMYNIALSRVVRGDVTAAAEWLRVRL